MNAGAMRSHRATRRVGAGALLVLCMMAATLAAAQAPGATPTPTSASAPVKGAATVPPPGAANTGGVAIAARPSEFAIDAGDEPAQFAITLEITMPPTALAAGVPTVTVQERPLVSPATIEASIAVLGSPVVERGADGKPTGKITQAARLTFAKLPRRVPVTYLGFAVTVGAATTILDIKMGQPPVLPTGAALELSVPSKFLFSKDEGIRLVLAAKRAAAPDISISAGPFHDPQGEEVIPYSICLGQPTPCVLPGATIGLGENQQVQIVLSPQAGGPDWLALPPGNYTGEIRAMSANGLLAEKSVTLVITSWLRQWLGALLLALGTGLSYFLTIVIPYRSERNRRLLIFKGLTEDLDDVVQTTASLPDTCKPVQLLQRIDEVRKRTGCDHLVQSGLIGASDRIPPIATLASVAQVREVADQLAKAIRALGLIALAHQRADATRFGALETLAASDNFSSETAKEIAKIFAPSERERASAGLAPVAVAEPFPSRTQIYFLEQQLSQYAALGVALAVVLSGVLVLILSKNTFGSLTDLITAFAWGFGLSVTGNGVIARPMPASLSYPGSMAAAA